MVRLRLSLKYASGSQHQKQQKPDGTNVDVYPSIIEGQKVQQTKRGK